MKAVLFILIVCGVLISRSSARGDQDLMFDEDIKEMTLDDILSLSDNSTDTDTNTSSFDIVDEKVKTPMGIFLELTPEGPGGQGGTWGPLFRA